MQVIVDADSPEILNQIERVVYHLHPTFDNPDGAVIDRHNNFELTTRAWGEFNLLTDVYFLYYEEPLTLSRYLNF
jgi:transcription initiation factor IIF auxiliary subunit